MKTSLFERRRGEGLQLGRTKPIISDNQFARGIQSKTVRGLRAESPVGGVGVQSPYELGRLEVCSPPNIYFIQFLFCFDFFFAYVTDDFKKNFHKK